MKTKEEKIDYILGNFDFEKAIKVMRFLEWKWLPLKSEDQIPTMFDLIMKAKELLERSYDNCIERKMDAGSATGGLNARCFYYEEGIELSLTFELTSFDTF